MRMQSILRGLAKMSTLERAYLKAMKVAEDAGEDEKQSIIEQATQNLPKVNKKKVEEIAFSRAGISQMAQVEVYTPEILKNK